MKELYLLTEDYLNEDISKEDFKEQIVLFIQNECRKAFEAGRDGHHIANETILGLEVNSNYEFDTFENYLKSINL